MKKKKLLNFILAVLILVTSVGFYKTDAAAQVTDADNEFRAVWVSSVLNLDFPSKKGLSVGELKSEIDGIVSKTYELGLNAIVFQVRPQSDALYISNIFPWSEYISGEQGTNPNFDPLEYFVEQAHKWGIELHAWINPYRITHTTQGITDVNRLAPSNPARLNPSMAIAYKNALYYDPGLPESSALVVSGIIELIQKYDIDGIHLDDYFYPGTDFPDDVSYAKYGNGQNREDWRRNNVNNLIKTIHDKIKEINPEVRFGVSPFAIWMNKDTNPLGSDTKGTEAFTAMYADTRRWVKEGWLDYICPQLYWTIGYDIADYQKLLNWWSDVCKDTGVDLYIGHAVYREFEKASGWDGEIIRQLKLNESFDTVKGSIFFRFANLKGDLALQIKRYYLYKNHTPIIVMDTLSVAQPSGNITVTEGKGFNFHGSAVPGIDLYVNGELVKNRTPEGFFSIYLPIVKGENTFTFTQEGQNPVSRKVTLRDPSPTTSSPAVKINYFDNEPYYATITADSVWVYPRNTTSGGSSWQLLKGQKDRIVAETADNKWIKLAMGVWIEKKDASCVMEGTIIENSLWGSRYLRGENADKISFNATGSPAVYASYEDKVITLFFGMQKNVPGIDTSAWPDLDDTVFTSVVTGIDSRQVPYYQFKLKEDVNIEGYYAELLEGTLNFYIKKRKSLSEGDKPLAGFKFVVDAGHGGTDSGARGPMGANMAEKDLNLINSWKLASRLSDLGAEVITVRDTDIFYTLQERTEINRLANPDMFISIHANSLAEITDGTNVNGLTVWYRNETSFPLAQHFTKNLHKINPITTRSETTYQANFYVCRPSWTPSVIIETSYMCNIDDYVWLLNSEKQDELADAIVLAILEYYRN